MHKYRAVLRFVTYCSPLLLLQLCMVASFYVIHTSNMHFFFCSFVDRLPSSYFSRKLYLQYLRSQVIVLKYRDSSGKDKFNNTFKRFVFVVWTKCIFFSPQPIQVASLLYVLIVSRMVILTPVLML